MKILHIISGLSTGGAEMMLYKLISKMNRDNFETQVMSLTDIGPVGEKIQAEGIPVEALGMKRGIPDPRILFKLARFLKKKRPDIIQSWMYHADLAGGLAAKMSGGIPVLWNIRHSNLDPTGNKKTTLWTVKGCAWLSNRLPSKIICCSYASKEVHSRIGYDENKMIVIPNGFDVNAFSPSEDARKKTRRLLGLCDETTLIGLIARFDPQKDHKSFFQAAGILHKNYPDVHLVLCGDGVTQDNPIIRTWVNEADVESVTHLLGRWDDMSSLQAALDMAVSSSYGEGFPNVLGEAMACGVPCVVTDVGDSARIIGNTGFVVPPRNAAALATSLKRMIDLGEERKKLGMLAQKRIEDNYSLDKIVSLYEKVYVDLTRNVA
jgi:glycosyltransferase involved in cell wall biosynthesis